MLNLSRLSIFTMFLLLAIAMPSFCMAWSGKVVSISDGDTIKVLHNDKVEKIRLYGIDTPEKAQDFGQKAKALTSALVAGRNVEVQRMDVDRYGRTVGLVTVDGQILNELIVRNGYAWVYRQYCQEKFCAEWIKTEATAKQLKKGLWIDSHAVPPWEWRHQGKQTNAYRQQSTTKTGQKTSMANGEYHGNVSSHKFHRPGCSAFNCKNCTAVFKSKSAAIMAGYVPCKSCNP
jgi:endonuclease YncB( thermonuclease family)